MNSIIELLREAYEVGKNQQLRQPETRLSMLEKYGAMEDENFNFDDMENQILIELLEYLNEELQVSEMKIELSKNIDLEAEMTEKCQNARMSLIRDIIRLIQSKLK